MASAPRPTRLTPEEYLAIERRAEFKSEFSDGVMSPREGSPRATAGTGYRHGLIMSNLSREIGVQLKGGPCGVISNELRVAIRGSAYTYPDLIIVCGDPQFLDDQFDTLLNPHATIEILSPSTQKADSGVKFARYRQIPSLRHYILVAQETPAVERYDRDADETWPRVDLAWPDGVPTLPDPAVALPLRDAYPGVSPTDHPA